ncbi:MAG: porin family protein [Gammaproteobacteria bacterium]|nr:porin family protein [Gammaproteobacteria bacterium]
MKKQLLGLTTLLLFTYSQSNWAAYSKNQINNDSGVYIGAQIGDSINHRDSFRGTKDKGGVSRFFGGVDFNKYWGLELGYTSQPNVEYNYVSRWSETNPHGTLKSSSVEALGKFTVPMYKKLSLITKLGVSYNREDDGVINEYSDSPLPAGAPGFSTKVDEKRYVRKTIAPAAGLGLSYSLTKNCSAEISYLNNHVGSTSGNYLLGFTYKFR